jgi:hypothetical protein
LIRRWQGYLAASIVQKREYDKYVQDYGDDALEKSWQNYLKKEAYFHQPSQPSDEEVIQYWESCLRKAKKKDEDGDSEDSSRSKNGSEDSSSSEDGSNYK